MTWINEGRHPGEFMVSEGNGRISRETVTIASGANLEPATVLGKVTASGKHTILAPAATDGSQNAAAILYGHAKAAAADVQAVAVVRMAEVKSAELVWPAGITAPQKTAALAELAALLIIART